MKNKGLIIFGSVAGVIVLILAMFGLWWVSVSNSLNQQSVTINQSYSNMDVQMQRRADLTPQLVNSVKGEMKNEQKIFGQIADARKSYDTATNPADKVKASDKLNAKMNILINAVHENYPQLASSNQVGTLMTQLEGSENRISQARRDYNEQVTTYNQEVVSFPASMVASSKGLTTKPFFQADPSASKAPVVNLE